MGALHALAGEFGFHAQALAASRTSDHEHESIRLRMVFDEPLLCARRGTIA
jgi:hypothetical protein